MKAAPRSHAGCAAQLLVVPALAFGGCPASAQAASTLEPVVVTATRSERPSFDVPASIDVLDAAALDASLPAVDLSEWLARVPGIVAQNRHNHAQDLQVSSRGFGARSTFGVRGVRLYVDGIPATMPDGQGQVSHIDLSSAARIEVLRGPYSVLYGNSSGGVISVFTANGGPDTVAGASSALGSHGTHRAGLEASGQRDRLDYTVSVNRFSTDGDRDHSAAQRTLFNGKLRYAPDADTRWTVVLNSVRMPGVQDPLGLTRAEFLANPRQAPRVAHEFDTRKSVDQQQAGATLDHRISANDALQWTVYAGTRETTQFLAIPVASQVPASSPGGVVDLARDFRGSDTRWIHRTSLLGTPAMLTAGVTWEELLEHRRGYQNFVGPPTAPTRIGVTGALRRDEANTVRSFDQYVQGEWALAERWTASAGMRRSRVTFDSTDRHVVNGDDSGATHYTATTHAAGLVFHAHERVNVHATIGRGFETPTLIELAYRPGGEPGLNFDLRAARSRQWEVGVKTRLADGWRADIAYFEARTSDEIVVGSNTGGRTTYANAGRTERKGVEASVSGALGGGFSVHGAVTVLDARYRDAFATCRGAPCASAALVVPAGNRIPGIPRHALHGELRWRQPAWGFETALEVRRVAAVIVDDLNASAADGYTRAGIRLAWLQRAGRWTLREFVRADNAANVQYAGSVIVNEGNARYFEAAPGRSWLAGVEVAYRF